MSTHTITVPDDLSGLDRCLIAHGAAYAGTWGPPATGVWELVA